MVRPLHQQNAVDIKGGREGGKMGDGGMERGRYGGFGSTEGGGKEGTRGEVR